MVIEKNLIFKIREFLKYKYIGIGTLKLLELLKYGEVRFYKGLRIKNKRKAVNFFRKIKQKGFIEYNLYYNDYGYKIKNT